MDSSISPPTKFVLVQRKGLTPEDTTWERWADLVSEYHLEDKVSSIVVGIDSSDPISLGPNTDVVEEPNNTNKGNMRNRPKREHKMPKYLCDYVTK